MGDPTVRPNKVETEIAASFRSVFKSRKNTGLHSGIAFSLFRFEYKGRDDIWYRGEIFPVTDPKSAFDKGSGNRVSIWIRSAADEAQMRELVHDLFPLDDNVLLKPTFAAYNSMLGKTVVSCMPCAEDFSCWISRQQQVKSGDYLRDQATRMIRSLVSFTEVMSLNGFVCDGLDDPKNYVMMDTNVKVLPFTIRKKRKTDNIMTSRNEVADLLQNHLNTIWKDIDVEEFIKCLRDPDLCFKVLLNHPLFLTPEGRLALYQILWHTDFSNEKLTRYNAITSYPNWINLIPAEDNLLRGILTYDKRNPNNNIPMYGNGAFEAHRFARDTCSHYFDHLRRRLIQTNERPKASAEKVDQSLKKPLPGLLSKVYALGNSLGCR